MCACSTDKGKTMTQADMMKYGIAAAVLIAAYKFGPASLKGAAVAIGAVAVAKKLPYVKEVV